MSESDLALSIAAINTRVAVLEVANASLQASITALVHQLQAQKAASSDSNVAASE